MPAQIFAVADAIGKDVERHLDGLGLSYKKISLDEKLALFLRIAVERMAATIGVSFDKIKPYITDYIGFGASIYERHHTMDVAKKASFLGLMGVELHSVDLGGASAPAALEIARRLCSNEERLVLIAGSEVPRGGDAGVKYYREVSDALLDKTTELHTQANLISLYALLADRLMHDEGITVADVEAITEYFRDCALSNDRAAMHGKAFKTGELKRYLAGVYATAMVAVATDHGVAMLVANDALLQRLQKEWGFNAAQQALYINGIGTNYADKYLTHRANFNSPAALAAKRAFARAGITADEIDYAWIYDCFTLMLVRQAADYFAVTPKSAAESLQSGFIIVNARKIPVNRQGGILNTQAAISLSATTGLVDIFAYAARTPDAQHFLFGGNGGIDCVNSVAILSRNALLHRDEILSSERQNVPPGKIIAENETGILYAAAVVKFNPGGTVPFALGAFRRSDGTLCLAHIVDADLTAHLDISDLKRDETRVIFRLVAGKPVAVLC
jgi:acetyl-CoA acyltransferase